MLYHDYGDPSRKKNEIFAKICYFYKTLFRRKFKFPLKTNCFFSGLRHPYWGWGGRNMKELDLRGTWNLRVDDNEWIPCTIPGDSHTALLRAHRIPHPYTGTQELAVQYLAQRDFIFERTIEIPEAQLRETGPYYGLIPSIR